MNSWPRWLKFTSQLYHFNLCGAGQNNLLVPQFLHFYNKTNSED